MLISIENQKREAAANELARICRTNDIGSVTSEAAQKLALRMAMEAFKMDDNARVLIEKLMDRDVDIYDAAERVKDDFQREQDEADRIEAQERQRHEAIEGATWRFV